jgi:hypothetical protein
MAAIVSLPKNGAFGPFGDGDNTGKLPGISVTIIGPEDVSCVVGGGE